ncbi:MAG: methionyl-tRNA formyltransferase [Proteobacteria bacterium]|nr:methionyl-tRNA formyltransferase [Pseudomonadota bacterium]
MRIVFMGSPHFALPSLKALHSSDKIEVVGVFSQTPKKSGRKMELKDTAVASFAKQNNIPLFTPAKINAEAIDQLQELNPDLVCVVSYGLILPQSILDVTQFINVHPSSLPRFRGAAPLQHTLIAGDETADICIMDMEKGIDTGAVYKRVNYTISEDMYLDEYHDMAAQEGAKHLREVVENWSDYKGNAIKQTEDGMIYAHKIDKETQKLDFSKPIREVYNLIRGISPIPAAKTNISGVDLKVYKADIISEEPHSYKSGDIVKANTKDGLQIACADGIIRLRLIQKAGKGRMLDTDLLNGWDLSPSSSRDL